VKNRRGRGFIAIAAALLLAACARQPANVLDSPLAGGRRVADLLAPDRPTVLLVYPPGYTFGCAAELLKWRELEKAGRVHTALVLTHAPTADDRKGFAIRRIHVAGVMARPFWRVGGGPPREYLVEQGVVRVAATGPAHTGSHSPVLARVLEARAGTPALASRGAAGPRR
jgi:hypothetical protein